MKQRCAWCKADPLYMDYHDTEWGVAVHDDNLLFEFLILEGMQAGLSWLTVLRKREHFRKAFSQFDPAKVARFSTKKIENLLLNPGIIRNRNKVISSVENAKAFLKIQQQFTSFDSYIWQFTDGKVIHNNYREFKDVPSHTTISDQLAKDLKQRGFNFVGTTICYAFMQATGMVNDHLTSCFRYREIN